MSRFIMGAPTPVPRMNGHSGGSFTVRCVEGPKSGTDVHFFSRRDLIGHLSRNGFEISAGPAEDRTKRDPPKTGAWSQWEVVARAAGPRAG